MPGCSAVGCKNRSEGGYKMLIFPRNEERRKQWAVKVNREDGNRKGELWKPTKYSFLCEKHFADDQWEKVRVDGKKKLKCNAVPTIFTHTVPNMPRMQDKENLVCPLLHTKEATNSAVKVQEAAHTSSSVDVQNLLNSDSEYNKEATNSAVKVEEAPHTSSSVDVQNLLNSDSEYKLKISRLEDFIKKQQKQISVMRKKISYLTLQNSRLKVRQDKSSSVTTSVKKVFNESQILRLTQKKVNWSEYSAECIAVEICMW